MIDDYLKTHAERFEQELCELLRIPSVSADPGRRDDIAPGGRLGGRPVPRTRVRDRNHPDRRPSAGLRRVAARGRAPRPCWSTATTTSSRPSRWRNGPRRRSSRRVRDGCVFARGATDDKGQMFTHVKSAEAWIDAEGRLPVNLKYLIEGEEEVGSANLEQFVVDNAEKLACDCVVISDGAQFGAGPAGDHLRPAGNRLLRACAAAARIATCTRARSAARSPIRPTPWREMLAALIDEPRQDPGARLLRRRRAADGPRARADRPRCRSTRSDYCERDRRRRRSRARRATRRSNAAGPGRRSTSAA